jgi:hypothetical protein
MCSCYVTLFLSSLAGLLGRTNASELTRADAREHEELQIVRGSAQVSKCADRGRDAPIDPLRLDAICALSEMAIKRLAALKPERSLFIETPALPHAAHKLTSFRWRHDRSAGIALVIL